MGESMIIRRGGGSGSGGDGTRLTTEIFANDGTFVVPKGVKDNKFTVIIAGGGGGGGSGEYSGSGGGGGGWVNKGEFTLVPGESIPITIGKGGRGSNTNLSCSHSFNITYGAGTISSFGTYISATGGNGPKHNGNIVLPNGSKTSGIVGGSGGAGGGGSHCGGTGFQFGGGGAGSGGGIGIGGIYGGNGGTGTTNANNSNYYGYCGNCFNIYI